MPEDLLTMSAKEVDRAGLIRRVLEGRPSQVKAAETMGMTARQVRRMCRAYEKLGPRGPISGKRGKPSNNQQLQSIRQDVLSLVRERYADLGPTLAAEKLRELHRFFVSKETLRQWMKAEGLWLTRKQRIPQPHQPRFRRECFGELVQIDGCAQHLPRRQGRHQRPDRRCDPVRAGPPGVQHRHHLRQHAPGERPRRAEQDAPRPAG